jgi:hypothetical protein
MGRAEDHAEGLRLQANLPSYPPKRRRTRGGAGDLSGFEFFLEGGPLGCLAALLIAVAAGVGVAKKRSG